MKGGRSWDRYLYGVTGVVQGPQAFSHGLRQVPLYLEPQ